MFENFRITWLNSYSLQVKAHSFFPSAQTACIFVEDFYIEKQSGAGPILDNFQSPVAPMHGDSGVGFVLDEFYVDEDSLLSRAIAGDSICGAKLGLLGTLFVNDYAEPALWAEARRIEIIQRHSFAYRRPETINNAFAVIDFASCSRKLIRPEEVLGRQIPALQPPQPTHG